MPRPIVSPARASRTTGAPRAALAAVSVAAALLGEATPAPALARETVCERGPAAPRRRYSVAAIGDSLTDPRSGGGGYLEVLRARCPASRFDAYGVGGQRTGHLRWRFAREVLGVGAGPNAPRYDHVVVLAGVNDLGVQSVRAASSRAARENLAWMYAAARRHGVATIALTLPPWTGVTSRDARAAETLALNDWIRGRAAAGDVDRVVDVFPLLSCGDSDRLCPSLRRFSDDLVHWNRAGHELVGGALAREIFSDCE
ncbi:MAG: SGNH/GDSL hydrolase family protein [Polyangiaceae bacterium]|nr:SGNH/GDSL hydrolase family protein [Polyangiaceae bacterium]